MLKNYSNNNSVDLQELYRDDGFFYVNSFLNKYIVNNINAELDILFNLIVFNGFTKGSIAKDTNNYPLKTLFLPAQNIRSINLLEVAIDILNLVVKEKEKNEFILSNLEVYSEKKNFKSLKFHTDGRRGMIRAQIYLKGGNNDVSGAFRYIKKSNNLNHNIEHEISNEESKKYLTDTVECFGDCGDLIVFDSWGFHGKHPCIEERRSVMFEFQRKDSNDAKSIIDLDGSLLSDKVVNNINLFINRNYKGVPHGTDVVKERYHVNFYLITKTIKIFTKYYFITLKKIVVKIVFKLKKLLNIK
jgi:hypothetical protein